MNLPGPKSLAIARREYLPRVKNKWFIATTLGFPLLIIAFSVVPGLLIGTDAGTDSLEIGLVDRVGIESERLTELLVREEGSDATVQEADVPEDLDRDELRLRVSESGFDAFLLIETETESTPGEGEGEIGTASERLTLLSTRSVGQLQQAELRQALRQILVETRLSQAGLESREADRVVTSARADLSVVRVGEEGAQSQEVLSVLAMVLTFVLYMMFIVYGQIIIRGVLEEKTSDIVEILISSVRPLELMLGKIVGIGAVGLTQIGIWSIVVVGLLVYGLASSAAALAEAGIDVSALSLPWSVLPSFILFFILGYLLYAACFAAVGAIVGDEQEAQQVNFPVMMLIIVPFLLAFPTIENPNATWAAVSSLVPFFSPILMLLRITMDAAALWEVITAVVLLVATTVGMAWLAGRIYRVGILMKGKRPNLPELLRWIRYG